MTTHYFIIILASLFIVALILFASFGSKSQNYETMLAGYKTTPEYQAVQTKTKDQLQQWISDGVQDVQILNEIDWKIDEAVFFNTTKDKAYLLLLMQDNDPQAELDYAYVLYAVLKNQQWQIYFAGLPSFVYPRDRFNQKEALPFPLLSMLGRKQLLNGYLKWNGRINDAFVNRADNDDLKSAHSQFLEKKI